MSYTPTPMKRHRLLKLTFHFSQMSAT